MSSAPRPQRPPPAPPTAAAVLVAAGRGTRMGGDIPKQYQILDGKYVLTHTLESLLAHSRVDAVVVVIHPDDGPRFEAALAQAGHPNVTQVFGGATRADSVARGLAQLDADVAHVLIHDAARPFVPPDVIDRVLDALTEAPGAAPALAVVDALWRGTDAGNVDTTLPRAHVWRAQTPQGFHLEAIRTAHARAPAQAADDVEVARAAGLDVRIVAGAEESFKLTRPEDMERARRHLAQRHEGGMDIRVGHGYDVHRFGPGRAVILCGIEIPHERSLQGHSDADVGMHAVTDAIYGALADGDIGRHFPPSDPQWKGAASDIFLRHAVGRAAARGYRIGNADCTLVCEYPKIGPHAQAMQECMAAILGADAGRVSVKATTSERLGFTGREEGIAALATVTLLGGTS